MSYSNGGQASRQPGRTSSGNDHDGQGGGGAGSDPAYMNGGQGGWIPQTFQGHAPNGYNNDMQTQIAQSYTRQTFPAVESHLPVQTFPFHGSYGHPPSSAHTEMYTPQTSSQFTGSPQGNGNRGVPPRRHGSSVGSGPVQTFPLPPSQKRLGKRKSVSGDGAIAEDSSMYEAAQVLNGFGSGSGEGPSAGQGGSSVGGGLSMQSSSVSGRTGLPDYHNGANTSGDSRGPGFAYELAQYRDDLIGGQSRSGPPSSGRPLSSSGHGTAPTHPGTPHDGTETSSPQQASHQQSQPLKKKKRKSVKDGQPGSIDDGEDSRRKTSRACDVCRSKKIRCDILILPHADGLDGEQHPQGLCTHCKNANLECTFFLPITETRFKRRRGDPDVIGARTSMKVSSPEEVPDITSQEKVAKTAHKRKQSEAFAPPPQAPIATTSLSAPSPQTMFAASPSTVSSATKQRDTIPSGRMEGPTSISFLLHTASAIPRGIVESYDIKHHTTWHITTDAGDGIIQVSNPPPSASFGGRESPAGETSHRRESGDGKPILTAEIISDLVNSYFDHVNPLFPIVSKAEFCAEPNPPPLLLYAMAGVAASRRGTSKRVFDGVRTIINGIIRNNDVLSDATFYNVQALLICALVGDLHAQPVTTAISASVTRIGTAIRMAQTIGLHRENGAVPATACDMAKIELRRRVWAGCVIMDRWCSAVLGTPCAIDLHDVDVLVPSPFDVIPGSDPVAWEAAEVPPYSILVEQLKLAILLGRILKAIYSPLGITATSDEQLKAIISDMDSWESNVPAYFGFDTTKAAPAAGFLHATYIATQFLFWRPFMRMSYTIPAHITTAMSISQWNALTTMAKDAIAWLETNEKMLDTIFFFSYSVTNCALVLYHHWIRRNDPQALVSLELLRDIVTRWENAVQPDHMSIRRKTIEVMSLLYEAAKKRPPTLMDDPAHDATHNLAGDMNPTTGVGRRSASAYRNFFWQNHPDRPGEGIFIAKPLAEGLDDVPDTLMIRPAGYPISAQTALASTAQGIDGRVQLDVSVSGNNAGLRSAGAGLDLQQPSFGSIDNSGMTSMQYPLTGPSGNSSQGLAMGGTNVNFNPALSGYGAMFAEQPAANGPDMALFMNMLDQTADPNAASEAAAMDHTMLGSLPLASYDWSGWEQYFDGLNQSVEPYQAGHGQGSG